MLRSVGAGGGRLPPATRWMWKRSHGGTIEAPPDERGGNRYVPPNATASHLDSNESMSPRSAPRRSSQALPRSTRPASSPRAMKSRWTRSIRLRTRRSVRSTASHPPLQEDSRHGVLRPRDQAAPVSATVGEVKGWFIEKINVSPMDATEHVLQVTGTTGRRHDDRQPEGRRLRHRVSAASRSSASRASSLSKMEATQMERPNQRALRAHLERGDYQVGVHCGRWD